MNDTSSVEGVEVEISVVIGRTKMPIHQLLKMGRGAVIALDANIEDNVWVYANNRLIARGDILVTGETVSVQITETIGLEQDD